MATMIVMFEVEASDSGAVMTALAPCMASLSSFSMESKGEAAPAKPKRIVKRFSKVERFVMEVLSSHEGPVTRSTIEDFLEEKNLSRTSAGPMLSQLFREGRIIRHTDDTFEVER